jgi:NAD-dependent DNA ligase
VKAIIAPVNCPACSSELELTNDQLFCRNDQCPAQWDKRLEHFVSTLKIKGFGPATIQKLQIQDYSEIYELTYEVLSKRLGSNKLAEKLLDEIEKSKSVKLVQLIPAFSIPLIGRSASQKLCDRISHIEDISEKSCTEAGIGPKATANLIQWLHTEFFPNNYKTTLPFKWNNEINKKKEVTAVVCISGKLKSFPTKAHAEKVLNQYGILVKSSLTKDCTHLINESGVESSKTMTARDRGVEIITNLKYFLGEKNGITKMDR